MTQMRGWDVSTDDVNNNFQRALSVGWFPFTIPAAYNGGGIQLQANGGIFSAGTFPAAAQCFLGYTLVTADDQPPHSLPLSTTGYSWRPGRHFKTWKAGAPHWTGEGTGPTLTTTIPNGNSRDYTLVDGAGGTPNLPNEGTYLDGALGATTPYGYYASLNGTANENPAGTFTLTPGQAVEVEFFTQTLPNDPGNPGLTCYPIITSITAVVPTASGDVNVPIDLSSFTVGFGTGSAGLPWPAWPFANGYDYGTPWNAHRAISTSVPTEQGNSTGGGNGYQDLWLIGGQRTQGHVY